MTLFCRKADGVLHREVGWNAYKKGTTLEVREEKLEAVHDVLQKGIKKDKNGAVSEKAVQAIMDNIQNLIAQGRFCAYLQPKVDAKTGKVCGAEALVRLLDEKNGIVPPGKFLPSIERAGLIRHIDLFVLESVCKIIRK